MYSLRKKNLAVCLLVWPWFCSYVEERRNERKQGMWVCCVEVVVITITAMAEEHNSPYFTMKISRKITKCDIDLIFFHI
jgi:hypothetical protein